MCVARTNDGSCWLGAMSKTNKKIRWWLFAATAFLVFVVLQVPASWLVIKFYKNNHVLQNVTGNIWQGQADWQQDAMQGSVAWQARPLELLRLRSAAQIELRMGQTHLEGKLAYSWAKKVYVQHVRGQVALNDLKKGADWQWPHNLIQIKNLNLDYKKDQGFSAVDGELSWLGGETSYRIDDRPSTINIPSVMGRLSEEQQKMILNVRDEREQKMLNITIDPSLMMDVQMTQRFLLNSPSYKGQASLDTYVLSSRQPLLRGGD